MVGRIIQRRALSQARINSKAGKVVERIARAERGPVPNAAKIKETHALSA
ncbi:MAG: hypothetical protein AAGF04_05010 [Chlamydiota bacterium]